VLLGLFGGGERWRLGVHRSRQTRDPLLLAGQRLRLAFHIAGDALQYGDAAQSLGWGGGDREQGFQRIERETLDQRQQRAHVLGLLGEAAFGVFAFGRELGDARRHRAGGVLGRAEPCCGGYALLGQILCPLLRRVGNLGCLLLGGETSGAVALGGAQLSGDVRAIGGGRGRGGACEAHSNREQECTVPRGTHKSGCSSV
jgi:hypothetical protein